MKWMTDEKGERYPDYTLEELKRIAKACWHVHALLPHADEVKWEHADNVREFHRAMECLPPLPPRDKRFPRTPDGHINNCALACGYPQKECQMCKGECPDVAKYGGLFR